MPTNEFVVLKGFKDGRYEGNPDREPYEMIVVEDRDRQYRWLEKGLIASTGQGADFEEWPWGVHRGRDLSPLPEETHDWNRIVACLNVWHDVEELQANMDTWYPYVDHVIAVDGAYDGIPARVPESTDGTLEFLRDLDKVELIETETFWEDQCLKRTQYFERAQEGDLLWKIDADEEYIHAEHIRQTPLLDVGWIRYISPIYKRGQDIPNVLRYREGLHYEKRHHWVFDGDGKPIKTNQRGGGDLIHRNLPIWFRNGKGDHRSDKRDYAARVHRRQQAEEENQRGEGQVRGREPLRIFQVGPIDPGAVIYRLHTAINATTPHESVMATGKQEYFEEPRQYDLTDDREIVRRAAAEADLIHVHVNYACWAGLGVLTDAPVVMHHHGSVFRRSPLSRKQEDEVRADLRLASNPEMLTYPRQDNLHFLPNPVPARRYKHVADQTDFDWQDRPFRVAHSPTKREKKGTEEFLAAIKTLQREGLDVEAVLIEGSTLQESIETKATCHACFDSFWLGMQCSGLEAGAMGRPVIAGDRDVRKYYVQNRGEVPYTYVSNQQDLVDVIRALAEDWEFYEGEAKKVRDYIVERHDYPAVMDQYLDLLDETFNWRTRFTIPDLLPLRSDE